MPDVCFGVFFFLFVCFKCNHAPPHRLHFLELTCWQALHFFLYSPGTLARKAKQNTVEELELEITLHHQPSSVEPDYHYPLTCTPENGVWMLGNFRFMPLPGSEELESYDVL